MKDILKVVGHNIELQYICIPNHQNFRQFLNFLCSTEESYAGVDMIVNK